MIFIRSTLNLVFNSRSGGKLVLEFLLIDAILVEAQDYKKSVSVERLM